MDSERKLRTVPWGYSQQNTTHHKLCFTILILWLFHCCQVSPTRVTNLASTPITDTNLIAPVMYTETTQVSQRRGRDVVINCTGTGIPPPLILWKKNGLRLENNYKYKLTQERHHNGTITSQLLLRAVTDRDKGIYRCEGDNFLGLHYINIEFQYF